MGEKATAGILLSVLVACSSGKHDGPRLPNVGTSGATLSFVQGSSSHSEAVGTAQVGVVLSTTTALAQDVSVSVADLGVGTATSADFSLQTAVLVFPAGSTSGTTLQATVTVLADTQVEGDETVGLTLQNPTNAVVAGASGHLLTIVDDDAPATLGFAKSASQAAERGGHAVTVVLGLAPGATLASPVSVQVSDAGSGTAAAGGDYSLPPTTVTFAAGSTDGSALGVTLNVHEDLVPEANETVDLQLGQPSGLATISGVGSHTVTVVDDDHLLGVGPRIFLDRLELGSQAIVSLSGSGLGGLQAADGLAFDPNAGMLYVADDGTDQLFRADPATGALTLVGPFGVTTIESLAFDPNTNTLYAVSDSTDTLYRVDLPTGHASPFPNALGFGSVEGLAYDRNTNTLYGLDQTTDVAIRIDTTTGIGAALPNGVGFGGVKGLAFDPGTNRLYGLDDTSNQLIRIDTTTGIGAVVGAIGGPFDRVGALAFDSNTGTLIATDTQLDALLAVVPATGVGSLRAVIGRTTMEAMAYDRGGGVLYGIERENSHPAVLLRIDSATGKPATVGFVSAYNDLIALAYDSGAGVLYGVDDATDTLLQINRATGAATALPNPLGFANVTGLAYDPAAGGTLYGVDAATDFLITIDRATGVGTARATGLGFTGLSGLAYDTDNTTLYGVDEASDALVSINAGTGAGTLIGAIGTDRVRGLASAPGVLYGPARPIGVTPVLVALDRATGRASTRGRLGVRVDGLAYDSVNGVLYGAERDKDFLVRIDFAKGEATLIGPFGFTDVTGLAFDRLSGVLYGSDDATNQLITINTATGAATAAPNPFGFANVEALAFDPTSPAGVGTLYGLDTAAGQVIRVNVATGLGIALPQPVGANGMIGLAYDAASDRLISAGAPNMLAIDKATGAGSLLRGTVRGTVSGLATQP